MTDDDLQILTINTGRKTELVQMLLTLKTLAPEEFTVEKLVYIIKSKIDDIDKHNNIIFTKK